MATKIYTKTGDLGLTSLLGGTRLAKSDLRIETYGTVDELNSYLGLVSDYCPSEKEKIFLKETQDRLFTIGSSLACDPEKEIKMAIPDLREEDIAGLENAIDHMTNELPEMKHFILPGGHPAVSITHIARCVCRRTERLCVSMQQNQEYIEPLIIKYLNRLSDYLFVLARFIGQSLQVAEVTWLPRT